MYFEISSKIKLVVQIVDDNYINLRCLSNILYQLEENFDIQLIECNDGDKSVESFKKLNKEKNSYNI